MPEWFYHLPSLNLLDSFNLTSVIDILIVAFVMYRLMLLIKGTRAVQLLKGLAVLVIAYAVSSLLNLYTLKWLLKQATTALVVALPIVFQPELRRALEKLGGGRLFSSTPWNGEYVSRDHLVAATVQAVDSMSRDRVGALIVFERSTGLEEFIDTGVKIGSIISAELLMNIFVPRTPLHDGAVIIREDRIMSAASVLPLTQRQNLSKAIGTRHRAGIGITEDSDAVALIVSEETGAISLVEEGMLIKIADIEMLSQKLTSLLDCRKQSKKNGVSALWQWR
ncbi:MAG: TIGR00159 family protein [Peptococcaceae bacterium]|nr:TIGR00159 family protein [Peptococcaceae bacterium]